MREIKIKAWAICFALNKKCMGAGTILFPTKKEAKVYRAELHNHIGGFEEDHHIIPCTITYKTNPKGKL